MSKIFIKTIEQYVDLYRCPRTGIAWVENGKTGSGHSAHPNIDSTGSIKGMKSRGYWREKDRTKKTNGTIYNIDKLVISDPLDQIAADHCQCPACNELRHA